MKIGHMEVMTSWVANAGAGGSATAAVTGDSLTIKNGQGRAYILAAWADLQAAGTVQIVRPSGHDTTRDLRFRTPASEVDLLTPLGVPIMVEPQETLAITVACADAAADKENVCLLIGYEKLPGTEQRLISWAEYLRRLEQVLTIEASITAVDGAAYSGDELINAESDLLKANRDYAVLGARVSVEAAVVTLRGPDTGNVRVGIPGNDLDAELTNSFFGLLSRAYDVPLIPVINSGNRASTFIGCFQDENAAAIPLSLNLGLLK